MSSETLGLVKGATKDSNRISVKPIMAFAEMEFVIAVRSRWFLVSTVSFGLLVLGISYFGLSASGYSGAVQDFTRTTLSLLNLVLYLIPLIALMAGSITFSTPAGFDELLHTQPVRRSEVLLGRFLGVALVLLTAVDIGFVSSGFFVLIQIGTDGILRYAAFVFLSNVLLLIFLAISMVIAVYSKQRSRVFALSATVWFLSLIFYDLLVIGITSLLSGRAAANTAMLALLLNPVDIVRVQSLISLNSPSIFGPAGAAFVRLLGGELGAFLMLSADLLFWLAGLVLVSLRANSKRDIN